METTTASPPPSAPRSNAPRPRRSVVERGAAMATRIFAGSVAALTLVQAGLAGRHLIGDPGALGVHEMLGTEVITMAAVLTAVTALVQVRVRWWRLPVSVVGFGAIWMQIVMGFGDQLDLHLPLGVAIFGTYLWLALASHRAPEPAH